MKKFLWPQPIWVLVGGCILAFLSAAVNSGIFLALGNSVAQMSGEISRMAREVATPPNSSLALQIIAAITAFTSGAAIAGFTIHHPTLDKSLPYGRCMMFIGSCLLLAHTSLAPRPLLALAFGGFASGFQNAMATHYRGIILRTTHITGLLTDIGSHLGMLLRGHRIALWKIWVPSVVVLFFFLGGVFGAFLFLTGLPFLLWLGTIYILGGLLWFVVQRLILKI